MSGGLPIRWPRRRRLAAGLALFKAGAPPGALAQYFGRNKVQYETLDLRVLMTEHFDIYYYPEGAEALGGGRPQPLACGLLRVVSLGLER